MSVAPPDHFHMNKLIIYLWNSINYKRKWHCFLLYVIYGNEDGNLSTVTADETSLINKLLQGYQTGYY